MASYDIDQKYLSKHAALTASESSLMSSSLFQILGLSVMLARKLVRARRLRRLDTTRETRSLQLYHHIIWLSREGLSTLQTFVTPGAEQGKLTPELQVLAAKLEASFFHIFCLFHNNPPITQRSIPAASTAQTPLQPSDTAGQLRRSPTRAAGKQPERLRDAIPSYTSDASYLTNPYASATPGAGISPPHRIRSPPGTSSRRSPAVPPGLTPIRHPTPTSAFIFPPENFVPYTANRFENASRLAADLLPGSHPLRLSVAIEHAAFLWDCVRDGDGSRALARRAIRDCNASKDPMTDTDFEDAAECIGVLGRLMQREGLSGRNSMRSSRSRDMLLRTSTPRGSTVAGAAGPQPVSPRQARAPASTAAPASAPAPAPAPSGRNPTEPTSPSSTKSSPTALPSRDTGYSRIARPPDTAPSSIQTSPTQTRSSRGSSGGSAAMRSRAPAIAGAASLDRNGSHSTKGSSGSAKSASGGERRSSSERESSALRGTGAMRGAVRSRGVNTSRAR